MHDLDITATFCVITGFLSAQSCFQRVYVDSPVTASPHSPILRTLPVFGNLTMYTTIKIRNWFCTCSIFMWLLSLACHYAFLLALSVSHKGNFATAECWQNLLSWIQRSSAALWFIPLVALITFLWPKKWSKLEQPIWPKYFGHTIVTKPSPQLRIIALSFCTMFLLDVTARLFAGILWDVGCTIAFAADGIGEYAIGERIFCMLPDLIHVKGDACLAAIRGYRANENNYDRIDQELNNTIARIYGPYSQQMARRYLILGETSRVRGWHALEEQHDLELAVASFSASEGWYQKSLLLFRRFDAPLDCAEAVSNIAYCQAKLGKLVGARKSLEDGIRMAASCSQNTFLISTLNRLALTASLVGQSTQAEELWYKSGLIRLSHRDDRDI